MIKGFVYEFMSNGTLEKYIISNRNKVSSTFIFMTLVRILEGIKYLHSNSLIHRDLKPCNVLINHDFVPYISDFETIRDINDDQIFTLDFASLMYSSPEQYFGDTSKISFSTDVFSLGAIVYFLFEKKHPNGLLELLEKGKIPQISNASPNIKLIYNSCVKYEPKDRLTIEQIDDIIFKEIYSFSYLEKQLDFESTQELSIEVQLYFLENILYQINNKKFNKYIERYISYIYYFEKIKKLKIQNNVSEYLYQLGKIYYIENSITKKNAQGVFDQDQTFQYQAKSGDHIAYRYEIISVIHTGSTSTIFKCTDHKSKEKVAIKVFINTPEINHKRQIEAENMKIITANDSSTDMTPVEPIRSQTSDSLPSNQKIKHFVKMIDTFVFRNHICIVMELLGESLSDFMKKKPSKIQSDNDQQIGPFSPLMVKLIAYQIMDGLADIHRKKIIHGDLRPQNILFLNQQQEESTNKTKTKATKNDQKSIQKVSDNKKEINVNLNNQQNASPHFTFSFTEVDNITLMSKVRIIDFSLSCKQTEPISCHIQNRFYRAPEVVLGSSYGTAIDVWSAGCIIVELFTGKPLFPAVNDVDLLARFIETLGQPPACIVEMKSDFQSKSTQNKTAKKQQNPLRNKFFGKDGSLLNLDRQLVPFKNRLTSILKSSDTMMIDFISKCLEWDKTKRMSAAKLCKHPWIAGLAKQNI